MHNDSFRMRMGVAAILIGLLPVWMVLAPLDITSAPEGWQIFVRTNAFAVPVVPLVFIVLALSWGVLSSRFTMARYISHDLPRGNRQLY
ncbi:hypothetical protein [Sphingorhabdus sp.]|uniref:hypothetical protein n=1 Tax=Sphingorhabdus sp. TaxID=1902408 RepID=UPI003D817D95